VTVYPAATLAELGVDVFVTDRFNGVSAGPYESLNLGDHVGDDEMHVRENRALVARAAGVDSEHLVTVRQVHGATVLDGASVTEISEADALVTDTSDLALAILVADCVPLALADTSSGRVPSCTPAGAAWKSASLLAPSKASICARRTLLSGRPFPRSDTRSGLK